MSRAARVALAGLLAALGCGGGSGSSGPPQNAFTGTLTVTSSSAATSCQGALHTVTFLSTGVDTHTPSAAGGECVLFVNGDATGDHQPAPIGAAGCPELSAAPSLATGGAFTAGPFNVPRSCTFEDALNPPATGGGGGGGY